MENRIRIKTVLLEQKNSLKPKTLKYCKGKHKGKKPNTQPQNTKNKQTAELQKRTRKYQQITNILQLQLPK